VGGVQGMASQPDRSHVVKTRGQTAGQISGVLNEKMEVWLTGKKGILSRIQ